MPAPTYLFSSRPLDQFLNSVKEELKRYVNSLERDRFLNSAAETLVEHLVGRFRVEPLQMHAGHIVAKPDRSVETNLVLEVEVPFTGEEGLWHHRASTFSSMPPRGGRIDSPTAKSPGILHLIFEQPGHDPDGSRLQSEIDREVAGIAKYLKWQHSDIEQFNGGLEAFSREVLEHRRRRLEQQGVVLDQLTIPLRRRDGEPDLQPIRMTRRLVRPLPASPKSGFKPEPGIPSEEFEHMLGVLRHGGRTMERAPATFSSLDEEAIRDVLLAMLNSHYKGQASGETFRKRGKTDILIPSGDRCAFVAECLIWRGPRYLGAKCDQLLSYLTWRDCKAALLVLNQKNARFEHVRKETPRTITEHRSYVGALAAKPDEAEWRFILSSSGDPAREVIVHTFLWDLYVADESGKGQRGAG